MLPGKNQVIDARFPCNPHDHHFGDRPLPYLEREGERGRPAPAENRQILFSFLVDHKGQLIAFPVDYMAYFGIDVDFASFKDSRDLLDYGLQDSGEEGSENLFRIS